MQTLKALATDRAAARAPALRQLLPSYEHSTRKSFIVAPSSRKPAAASPARVATLHPSLMLDAACAACCVLLLASSAARQRQASSVAALQAAGSHTTTQTSSSPGPAAAAPPPDDGSGAVVAARCAARLAATTTAGTAPVTAAPAAATTVCALPPPPRPPGSSGAPGRAAEAVVVVMCTLLVAASNAWFKLSGSSRGAAAGAGSRAVASTEAAARLARLEALTDKQLAEFASAVRQIDKLQVRTRLTGGDIRRPLAQLQSSSADQSAMLVRLASEQDALRGQLRDTQALLAALQGLTAKQFQVTVEAIKQLRSAQAAAAAAGGSSSSSGSSK